MAQSDTNLASLVRQAERPPRWGEPLDPDMSEDTLDMLLASEPFCRMDASRFPSGTPLREILRNDSAVREYEPGEIVLRKDDYGTSAFLVLGGEVDVVIRPEIDPRLLGRAVRAKKTFVARLAQLWNNNPEPEGWRKRSPRASDNLKGSFGDGKASVYLQDYPRIISGSQTAKLGEGSMFGEISALSRMPRTATVVAASPVTRLLEFTWEGLRDIMKYDPALKARIDTIYRENSLKSFLSNHPLFNHLDDAAYKELCDAAQLETYGDYNWSGAYKRMAKEGEVSSANEPVIVREGDYLNGIHMIRAGFCRVSRKYGGGERTLNYIGAGSVFGFGEIANHWENPDGGLQATHSLRSLGYAHLIFIPTAALEKFANRKWAMAELGGPLLPDVADAGLDEDEEAPPAGLMEFMAEHRFLNGTKSMVIDMDRCTRCDDCVRACASTHDGNPRFLRHGPMIDNLMIANACMHCVDPVCMIGCPTGAIHRTSFSGEVVINPATCIGCTACANNCPYDSIRMVEVRSDKGEFLVDEDFQPILKATKCDFCVEQKSGPACMNACPHDALSRTDLTRITPLAQWLKKEIELVRRRLAGLLLTAILSAGMAVAFWKLSPSYPRHPHLSGWVLLAVMLFLTFFNFRKKVPFLRMGSVGFWLQVHIYVGIISGALFVFHIGLSWPHGLLNQVIAVIFAIVFVSGVVGLWISRAFPKRLTDAGFETPFERMPQARHILRTEAESLVLAGVEGQVSPVIADFYTEKLGLFFARHCNLRAHLLRSQAPQAAHQSQFDEIRRYTKRNELEMLGKLEDLVERKHLLDYQYALQYTLRVWLFAHIPLSYSLLILSVAHIIVVHSFSGSAP